MWTQNSLLQVFSYLATLLVLLLFTGACDSGSDTESGPAFSSGNLAPGETFSYTFREEGTVEYFCEIHVPDMQGAVIVSSGSDNTGQDTVEMINIQFQPGQITVAPNTEVVWINNDSESHTVASGNPQTEDGGGY